MSVCIAGIMRIVTISNLSDRDFTGTVSPASKTKLLKSASHIGSGVQLERGRACFGSHLRLHGDL